MKDSHKTMTFADKTSNMYRLTKEQYDKLIRNFIISTYKKANRTNLMRDKEVIKRMETKEEGISFITIKYHKKISITTLQSY